ncbi:GGDEF domain-containing protein [Bacillus horti]|nr:GGDEF domain-containing protein [Bacillus horti]
MKYEGRVFLTLFSLILNISFLFLVFKLERLFTMDTLLYLLVTAILSWLLGYQYDKVKYYSYVDHLTKCYNRSFIEKKFSKIGTPIQPLGFKSKKMVVYFFDVDHFKHINDRFGHHSGDKILQVLASIIIEMFSDRGYVVRWGGDEFAVFLPVDQSMDIDTIQNYIEYRLRNFILDENISFTVSVGQAVFPDEGKGLKELMQIADQNMYMAKNRRLLRKESME